MQSDVELALNKLPITLGCYIVQYNNFPVYLVWALKQRTTTFLAEPRVIHYRGAETEAFS